MEIVWTKIISYSSYWLHLLWIFGLFRYLRSPNLIKIHLISTKVSLICIYWSIWINDNHPVVFRNTIWYRNKANSELLFSSYKATDPLRSVFFVIFIWKGQGRKVVPNITSLLSLTGLFGFTETALCGRLCTQNWQIWNNCSVEYFSLAVDIQAHTAIEYEW